MVGEPVDELVLLLLPTGVEPDLRGRALREHLPKLPQLEQRDGRIRNEVLLRLRRERDEPCVVVSEEREVG